MNQKRDLKRIADSVEKMAGAKVCERQGHVMKDPPDKTGRMVCARCGVVGMRLA